ncbi:hypothetical protein K9N68_02505 [Kovacikia minuta CCNUW1]|uniref:serine/threonine protein kinase n=1 Tax=Kovacikia minuta TaxID=2931930 RepID=UPI001CCECF18|nr:hypothetical protein K9N68_02505 [Kovacikia minuta CCNUW1]
MIHRDIKPSNLILGSDRRFYLVDFGAVQERAKAEGVSFTVVGTSGYAAPEQLWGRTVASSDLYALGATLVYLLTGIPPGELPQRNLRIQFRDRLSLSPNFADWLEQLLDPNLEQRFSSACQALEALENGQNSLSLVLENDQHKAQYGRLAMLTLFGVVFGGILIFWTISTKFSAINNTATPPQGQKGVERIFP